MTETVRTTADMLARMGDSAAAHSTNREMIRDIVASFDVTRSAVLNVRDAGYNAIGDGGTQDYTAFQQAEAALPITGGTILVPPTATNVYRIGQELNFTKPIRLVASLPSASVADTTRGTVLLFDTDVAGVTFNGDTTLGSTQVASRGYAANYSIMDGFLIASAGGTVDVDGIKLRCPGVLIRNCHVRGFKRNGIRIVASVGGAGETIGNANLWRLEHIYLVSNGSDGLFTDGTDSNAGVGISIDATNNGGWGIYDSSFLGNTYIACHTSGNTVGPYKADGTVSANVFLGCYQEGSVGMSSINSPSIVLGGNLAGDGPLTSASDGFVFGAGTSFRGQLNAQNTRGAVSIGSGLALGDTSMSAFTFGSSDDTATLDAYRLIYDNVNLKWDLTNRNSGSRQVLSLPGGSASLRAFAPDFKNGLYLNGGFSAGGHVKVGSAAPTTGTWVKGDRVFNDYTVSGTATGIEYWYCQLAGTPGTWVANRAMGSFTCAANTNTIVSNINIVGSGSRVVITATNNAAAVLMGGTKALFVNGKTANTSFAVTTRDGTAAAGTETFDYVIFN